MSNRAYHLAAENQRLASTRDPDITAPLLTPLFSESLPPGSFVSVRIPPQECRGTTDYPAPPSPWLKWGPWGLVAAGCGAVGYHCALILGHLIGGAR